jgi:hypothetical protein
LIEVDDCTRSNLFNLPDCQGELSPPLGVRRPEFLKKNNILIFSALYKKYKIPKSSFYNFSLWILELI